MRGFGGRPARALTLARSRATLSGHRAGPPDPAHHKIGPTVSTPARALEETLMTKSRILAGGLLALALGLSGPSALAQDKLKIAAGQRGNWDTTIAEVGQRAGIFKKHGLELEILWTQGGGETQQAVISGSVDIGVAPGIMGVLSAYSKGAPVRIIGAETTGASDLFWYVPASSPIKSLKDTEGKTIAYSTNGSSTHGIVTAFMKQYDLKAKPTATGRRSACSSWTRARSASSRRATTRRRSRDRRCGC
jgi:hypothetical protein